MFRDLGRACSPTRAAWLNLAFRAALTATGIFPSLSRMGDCWDNAVADSFFATLEHEFLAHLVLRSHRALPLARWRPSSTNGTIRMPMLRHGLRQPGALETAAVHRDPNAPHHTA